MLNVSDELIKYKKDDVDKFKYFHKTTEGGYAQFDEFLGITVPDIRKVANKVYKDIKEKQIQDLFNSQYHEERLCALIILVLKSKNADVSEKYNILEFYLKNTKNINGWDLVDLSAPYILGNLVLKDSKAKKYIYSLSDSANMWEQRIAIVSNLTLIRSGIYTYVLDIADKFLESQYDLIHKALGWMLREIGKKDFTTLYNYLVENYTKMPRTMLRYSIERFDENLRQKFLKGEI